MKNESLYTIGQFMALTHVTKKTLRYYDEHNILKPTRVSEHGARFYSQDDLAKLQQIMLLKYLGFSLADIREMTITTDSRLMKSSLAMQKKLIEDRIEQLQVVSKALDETSAALVETNEVDWNSLLNLIQTMNLEQSLMTQYQNASNISARIQLHSLYSSNTQGWFPWIFEKCQIEDGMRILEVGCGDGSFWTENWERIPEHVSVVLSDISQGMLRDARRKIGEDPRFSFEQFDCCRTGFADGSFDLVIANHVLFYCEDLEAVCAELRRVLKPGGVCVCSTYGSDHMQEISGLVTAFDDRIALSANKLYARFGRENGAQILHPFFSEVAWSSYQDHLVVPDADPLISYILSCHGNQTRYILDRYKEFKAYVAKAVAQGFYITKDAGLFRCQVSGTRKAPL